MQKQYKLLQVFRNSGGVRRFIQIGMSSRVTVVSEMYVLLEKCCHVCVFDASVHQIRADHIIKQPGLGALEKLKVIGFSHVDNRIQEAW